MADQRDAGRVVDGHDHGEAERQDALQHGDDDEEPAAVEDVGEQPADQREQHQRTELGEQQHAHERR